MGGVQYLLKNILQFVFCEAFFTFYGCMPADLITRSVSVELMKSRHRKLVLRIFRLFLRSCVQMLKDNML